MVVIAYDQVLTMPFMMKNKEIEWNLLAQKLVIINSG